MAKQLLIYESSVPLSAALHRNLSFEPVPGYGFASGINAVPLTAVEIPAAAPEYAIVFTSGSMSPKSSMEFEVELKHMRGARIASVQSQSPSFQTQMVSQTPDGDSVLVKVRVTDLGAPTGPFLFPCRFSGNGKTSDFWIFGTVR